MGRIFFRSGDSANNPATRWGEDVAKTPVKLQENVVRNQKFERHFEKWCGCASGPNTFFNAVYPVALVPQNNPQMGLGEAMIAAASIENAANTITNLMIRFNQAADLADEPRPFPQMQGSVMNFLLAMQKSVHQLMQLNRDMGNVANVGIDNFFARLAQLNRDMSSASQSLDPAIRGMRSASPTQTGSNNSGLVLPKRWGPGMLDQTAQVQGNFLIIDRGGGASARHYVVPLSREKINIPDPEPFGGPGGSWQLVFQCQHSDSCIQGAHGGQADILFPSKEAGMRFLESWHQHVR